ncbi:MAG: IPTL-CTERM sorting domain-containing protein [Burkholderiales bacterium]|nr:IPTL-CTERM sorting domain-containing protein [Burkholderiales bacterium]ODU66516.1 MAG: hypothetical protein ABT05_05175 [Lautropia sp. SCN 66-9]
MKIRTAAALMVSLGMASSAVAASFSYSGPPVPIPEAADLSGANPGAQVGAPITVSGLTQPVGKVVISIDGTACTDAPGATTVGIDHTFVSDLVLTLRAPDGTEVVIGQWADGGGNNLCQVVFDDAEAAQLLTVPSVNAPFTGRYRPFSPLSAFAGRPANGTWTLLAQDFFSEDTGSIRAWSIDITSAQASAPTPVPTLSEWALIGLSSLMAAIAVARVRRRQH